MDRRGVVASLGSRTRRCQHRPTFTKGAKGTIIPNSGPKTSFTVTEMEPGVTYTFVTKLPVARLQIRRDFVDGPDTTFRHSVWFDGALAPLWAALLGRGFRRQLPSSMRLLADEATRHAS